MSGIDDKNFPSSSRDCGACAKSGNGELEPSTPGELPPG
jgi:hypothetical protein